MKSFLKNTFAVASLTILLSFMTFTVREVQTVYAGAGDNIVGWAWSDNIGWISMNCVTDSTCGTSNYGVNINPATGAMTGYAWSDNIGWISFNGTLDLVTGAITGWAQACAGTVNGDCTGAFRTDGWDGQISLAGLSITGTTFGGFAWGSDVVGWVDFSGVSSTVNLLGPIVNVTAAPSTSVTTGTPVTLSWTSTAGATSCAISGAATYNGLPANGSQNLGPITSSGTYTVTCTNGASSGSGNITITVIGPAVLTIAPTNINFGTVAISEVKDSTTVNASYITITNTGGSTLNITSISPSANFACVSGCTVSLGAGLSQVANIRLTAPGTPGALGQSVTVNSNVGTQAVTVNATVSALISTNGPLNFGKVILTKTKDAVLTIHNNSSSASIPAGTVSTGGAFSCVSCAYGIIPPNGNASVTLRFSPGSTLGIQGGTATIGATGESAALSGEGVRASFDVKEK